MYNKFVLTVNLAVATCTSFLDIIFPGVTQSVTMYICSNIQYMAGKAIID